MKRVWKYLILWAFLGLTLDIPDVRADDAGSGSASLLAVGKPVSVQLNWKNQFEYAAFYTAIEKGYYREAGLHVSLREGGADIDVLQEVLTGRADFGVANSSLAISYAEGKPIVVLAALMQHSAFALLARRDRGIENVGDLKGKVISCAAHACGEIEAYLKASGLRREHIRLVSSQSSKFAENLQVSDATDIFISNQGYQLIGHENEYIMLTPRSAGIDLYGDVIFTTRDEIDGDQRVVTAFREATLKGLQYAMTHRDEIIDLILRRYNTQNKTREHLKFEANKLYELSHPDLVDPGYMSLGRWRHVRDVYASLGMLPADFLIEGMLYQAESRSWPAWLLWWIVGVTAIAILLLLLAVYLRNINRHLTRQIAERERAEEALRESQSSFRTFVDQANSLIAHEVRTPLSILQIHLDLLDVKQQTNWACSTNIEALKTALSRLRELLEKNLKQIFVSTSFSDLRRRVDLLAELERIFNEYAELSGTMHRSRVSFTKPSFPISVLIAPEMINTIFFNLLDNAFKYSLEEANVEIGVRTEDDYAVIEMSSASAIPLHQNPERLFDKHERGDSPDSLPGTGVGLYLVRLIVEAHGGDIHLTTAPPDRFVVKLNLPCNQTAASAGANPYLPGMSHESD